MRFNHACLCQQPSRLNHFGLSHFGSNHFGSKHFGSKYFGSDLIGSHHPGSNIVYMRSICAPRWPTCICMFNPLATSHQHVWHAYTQTWLEPFWLKLFRLRPLAFAIMAQILCACMRSICAPRWPTCFCMFNPLATSHQHVWHVYIHIQYIYIYIYI